MESENTESKSAKSEKPMASSTKVKNFLCNFDDEPEGNSGDEHWEILGCMKQFIYFICQHFKIEYLVFQKS